MNSMLRWCSYHARTAVLFTASDFKTILLPIVRLYNRAWLVPLRILSQCAFACATAPLYSPNRLLFGAIWVWIHQFMCNVSNQARTHAEDAVNKPWRPLPAGRINEQQAVILRWILVVACFASSALHGVDLMLTTLGLFLTTFIYDELGFAGHYFGKSLCNIAGYITFEIGATKLMGESFPLYNSVSHCMTCQGAHLITCVLCFSLHRRNLRPGRYVGYRGVY